MADHARSLSLLPCHFPAAATAESLSHPHHLIHQFMQSKNSSNHHFHYHLYQYMQTTNNSVNMFDQPTPAATSTASTADNKTPRSIFTTNDHFSHSMASNPLSNYEHELQNLKYLYQHARPSTSSHPYCCLNSAGSDLMTIVEKRNKIDYSIGEEELLATPSSDQQQHFNKSISSEDTTPIDRTKAKEKIINVDMLKNDAINKKTEIDCSCMKKSIPYQINEKNVWQVYETSDCKFTQSKFEYYQTYQPHNTNYEEGIRDDKKVPDPEESLEKTPEVRNSYSISSFDNNQVRCSLNNFLKNIYKLSYFVIKDVSRQKLHG